MPTHRFGRKIKLPATRAIKHQILKLMLQDHLRAQILDTNANEGTDVRGGGVAVGAECLRQSAPAAIPSG
jgi:hypothetical protein